MVLRLGIVCFLVGGFAFGFAEIVRRADDADISRSACADPDRAGCFGPRYP